MNARTVWILGAGFSRPLGGPLLSDLFSMRNWRQLEQVFPNFMGPIKAPQQLRRDAMAIYVLYHYGRGYPEGNLFGLQVTGQGERRYAHAEDFLVQLERMGDSELYQLLTDIKSLEHGNPLVSKAVMSFIGHGSSGLNEKAVRIATMIMAFECSAFHQELLTAYGAGDVCEPYLPYQDWGAVLTPKDDVLISFNYDFVIEAIVKPHEDVPLLKLHGSVSDAIVSGTKIQSTEPYALLKEQDYQPKIKIPGKSKAQMDECDRKLWAQAEEHLKAASKVIFLGYGLPESDAFARQFLLRSLGANGNVSIEIEIVLGEPSFRTERIVQTLRRALDGTTVSRSVGQNGAFTVALHRRPEVIPMYAQDYIQAYAQRLAHYRENPPQG